MEKEIEIGAGYPTRVVALETDRGFFENEAQVFVDGAWERLLTFAPPRDRGTPRWTAESAFARAVELALENGPRFFPPWFARRSATRALAAAKAAEEAQRAKEHAAAAPKRVATVEAGEAELARRADEKAAAAEARARLLADEP